MANKSVQIFISNVREIVGIQTQDVRTLNIMWGGRCAQARECASVHAALLIQHACTTLFTASLAPKQFFRHNLINGMIFGGKKKDH
jgi:hypothetical protein